MCGTDYSKGCLLKRMIDNYAADICLTFFDEIFELSDGNLKNN